MVVLHIVPTVTQDFTRDYVMLIPARPDEDVSFVLATEPADPCVVERDIAFAGLTAFRKMYDDIVVHTVPL